MKTTSRLFRAYSLVILLTVPLVDFAQESMGLELTTGEQELASQCNGFAFRLFGATRGSGDMAVSPLSVTYALSLLNNGASCETREEISQALGFGNTSLETVNAFCHKVMTTSDALDPQTRMQLANAVFVNEPCQLLPGFQSTATQYYDAWLESRDFHDGQTLSAINQWGSDHTNGMIPEVLNEQTFDPNAVSYLLNAVWFKGTWTLKFDPAETQEEAFGSKGETVPMMYMKKRLYYCENDICQALRMPYGNESFSMTVLLPREGKTLDDVLGHLESEWADSYLRMPWAEVDVKIPRMDITTSLELNKAMKSMGMERAFNASQAEFPYFCDHDTYVGLLKHDGRLKMDEEGTEAAAITTIIIPPGLEPGTTYEFHADRPFLYVISEATSGLIFFIGQMTGNAAPAEGYDAVTLTQAGIGTYCSDHDLDFSGTEGLKAYIASGYDQATGTVLLTRVGQVPAGTGVVLMGDEGTSQVPWAETGYTYANMLCGVLEPTEVPSEDGGYRNYILADGADGVMFYQSSGSGSLPAHRAYLRVHVGDKPLPLALPYSVGDSTTGVGDALRPSAGGSIYSLSGQRVSSPRKGLYVRDGKKVIIP